MKSEFELSEHIVWSILGSFSPVHCPGQGYLLQAFPISFLKLFLSHKSSSEAAACPSTQQSPAALLPSSSLLQINPVLFVLPLSEFCFHIAQPVAQPCKIFSILRKKQQCSCPCPVQHFQRTSRCSADVTVSPANC